MIYEIFIIKEGGQCLLRKAISDSEKIRIDEDLFSSFTCAIRSFANELMETVQTIELKQFKLVFFSFEKLLIFQNAYSSHKYYIIIPRNEYCRVAFITPPPVISLLSTVK